jgi:pyridoxamine 5'-phosphate oxidase
MNEFEQIRREYGQLALQEADVLDCPIAQFNRWFSDILPVEKTDPTSMVLSTVDEVGHPDSRIVLLKGISDGAFLFYTNYKSTKAIQIKASPYVALNFYWPHLARQVRIRGRVERLHPSQSDAYFATRPKLSQLSALASPQSQEISGRDELESRLNELIASHQDCSVVRPKHWGGYQVMPDEVEFWQGRDNRMSDRIHYYRKEDHWVHRRLAP